MEIEHHNVSCFYRNCRHRYFYRACCQNVQEYELEDYEHELLTNNNTEFHNHIDPENSLFFRKYLILRKNNLITLLFIMVIQFIFFLINFFNFDEIYGSLHLTEDSFQSILNTEIFSMVCFTIQLILVAICIMTFPYYRCSLPLVLLLLIVRFVDLFTPLFYNYNKIIQFEILRDDDGYTTIKNLLETYIGLRLVFSIIGNLFLSIIFLFPNIVAISNHIIHNFRFNLEVDVLKYLMIPFESFIILFCILGFGILYQINLLQGFEIALLSMTLFTHITNLIFTPRIIFDEINQKLSRIMSVISNIVFIAYPFVVLGFLLKYELGFDLINVIQTFYFGRTVYYDLIIRSLLNRFKDNTRETNNIIRNSGMTQPIAVEVLHSDSSII